MKKQMNIVLTALTVIALMGAVSCNKVEELEGNGSTIRFGVSTIYENGPATKTEYSGKDQNNNSISSSSTYERIDWLSTDKIRILCDQASLVSGSNHYADYSVSGISASSQKSTASITPADGNGLQWGTGTHHFYGYYPSAVQNSNATIVTKETNLATVGGTIPATQTVTLNDHTFKPNMDYAYMYAVKAGVSAGSSVSLDFKPLVTTLEFTLLTKADDPITSKLTSVKLSSSQSTSYLTGAFTAELTTSGLTAVTMGDITSGGNEITITLPDGGVQLSTNAAEAYTVTFLTLPLDQTELTLTLGFADSSKRTLKLKDNGSWITVAACKKTYIWKLDAPKTVGTETSISGGTAYKFGDAYLTNGILKKDGSTFSIEEDPFVLCTAYGQGTPSQGSSSGTRHYFDFIELGQYFSNDSAFDENSDDIPDVRTVSYNGHNWRMPTRAEWAAATTTAGRTGSTVNGTSGARYALVLVDLTGSSYEGKGLSSSDGQSEETNSNHMAALLLFPDGATVTCDAISSSSINSSESCATSTVSYADISTLVSGGCVVLPAAGNYNSSGWHRGGFLGSYWSGTGPNNSLYGCRLCFYNGLVSLSFSINKSYNFFPVVLARCSAASISGGTPYKFGDAYLTNGILRKDDSEFSIEEDPFVLCTEYGGTAPSQGSSSGTRYYFNYIELGQYFSNNPSFDGNSGNIPAVQTVSYNGHNWRMPSQGEWAAATTTAGRTGSTVNGTSGARYALVLVDLTGSVHAGEGLTSSDGYSMESNSNYMAALLLFPDGATVTCDAISSSSINSNSYLDYSTSTVSYTDISTLVSGGCVVLPAAGIYRSSDWYVGGTGGIYWSGSEDGTNDGYGLYFPNRDGYPEARNGKSDYFFPVVLARRTTEISGGTAYKFGDAYLTNGILKKAGSTFSIEEDPFVLCTAYNGTDPSQGSSSGTRYYFNFIELGQYFSNNASFNENSGNIPAARTVSYNGQNWRMPSQSEWAAATTTAGRTGSTVNGTSGARYAKVLVDLTGSSYEGKGLTTSSGGSGTSTNYMAALLLFPDGATVTCDAISSSSINNQGGSFATSTVSYADISTLVSGGCVVLPAAGYYFNWWLDGGTTGTYWSGSVSGTSYGYGLYFGNGSVRPGGDGSKSDSFYPVVLARGTTYSIASAIADICQSGSGVTTGLNQGITISVTKTAGASVTTEGAWKAYFYTSAPTVGDEVSPSWSETPLQDAGSNDWLSLSSYTGDGTGNAVSVSFTGVETSATMVPGTSATGMISTLRSGSGVTDLDLSTYNILDGSTGAAETANSYVIKTHGSYLIPCVYGNAYTGGAVNAGAYSNSTTGTNPLNTFINADGNTIGSAVITSDPNLTKGSHLSARVVWQDVMPGFEMITDANLEYVSTPGTAVNCPYIRVTFPQDKIVPGNVVVALYDDDNAKILWSWHLWVTTESLTTVNVLQSDNTTSHNFLNVNLGWTHSISYTAGSTSARDQYVIIVCTESGKVIDTFHVSQAAYSTSALTCTQYSNTYYQWGRKDPFLPSSGSNTNKAISYNTSIITPTVSSTNQIENGSAAGLTATEKLGWMTKNPYVFNTDVNNVPNYYNLWDAGQGGTGDHEVVKTVYDPSPRGFKLPNRNAFTGFTSSGNTQDSASNIYGDWVEASGEQPAGRNFSTTHSTSDKTFFIPASGGRRSSSSQLGNFSSSGAYWSAAPYNAPGGNFLDFNSSHVGPHNGTYRTTGFSVRPVQE